MRAHAWPWLLLALTLVGGPSRAQDQTPVRSLEQVREVLDDLVARSFPELDASRIRLRTFDSDSVYFQSRPGIGSFLFKRRLTYVIQVNPKVFELAPPRAAVVAILAHELCHSSHYTLHSRWRVASDLRQFVSPRHMVRFERRTDLDAVSRGYAEGLVAYREWIYPRLTPQALAQKQRNYLGPDELRLADRVRREHPALFAAWRAEPPRDLAGFEASLAAHLADCEEHPAAGLRQALPELPARATPESATPESATPESAPGG